MVPAPEIHLQNGIAGRLDHMQKIGPMRSVNPYNPFLGMETAISRKAKGYEGRLYEEALSREQALRFYTINNAYILFRDHEVGSLEPGKWADFLILDQDFLKCRIDQIKDIRPAATLLGQDRCPVQSNSLATCLTAPVLTVHWVLSYGSGQTARAAFAVFLHPPPRAL